MGLFGKKKVETPPVEELPPLPTLETLHQETHEQNLPKPPLPPIIHDMPRPMPRQLPANAQPVRKQEPQPPVQEKAERPAFAPLFVKIDRYRNILNALGQLRTSVVMIRNSFSTLNELEKARFETLKLIEEAVGKVESKLSSLDTELLRPTSAHMDVTPEYHDVETVQATVADLKGQITQLKAELEQLS